MFLSDRARRGALLKDISQDRRRVVGHSEGGDFHLPFWADAKRHARGEGDLSALTEARIEANPRNRKRLYPLLLDGFLQWWNERRRWINEPFEVVEQSVKARYVVPQLNCIVKIENLFSVEMSDGSYRLIYPYFAEEPELAAEGARLAFWLMGKALPSYGGRGFRVLDVLRASSFRAEEHPLHDNEEAVFIERYSSLLEEWRKLRSERE